MIVSELLWLRRQDLICIFAKGENRSSHQCLHWWQELSTGQFHCYGFKSSPLQKNNRKKAIPSGMTFSFLVAEAGLEPTTSGL